jgi:hypothetical protein
VVGDPVEDAASIAWSRYEGSTGGTCFTGRCSARSAAARTNEGRTSGVHRALSEVFADAERAPQRGFCCGVVRAIRAALLEEEHLPAALGEQMVAAAQLE